MKLHRNCITDTLTREYWRDYQGVLKDGNPFGLSFTEYVAHRIISTGTRFTYTNVTQVEWHVAQCGHQHPWGQSCSTWTEA